MQNDEQNNVRHDRRKVLGSLGAMSLLGGSLLMGCKNNGTGGVLADSSTDTSDSSDTTDTSSALAGSCVLIPQETEGPYPLMAVLSNSAMVRADITEGKSGVPLTVKLKIYDVNNSCAAISGASVYIWHCDKDGVYSGYSQPGINTVGETFCRGIQDTDADGEVTFTTIYPGWYTGRITHIHFRVFLYGSTNATATSQIAFPQAVTTEVYNSSLYVSHGQNTSVSSFASDNIFSDGTTYQMATISGDIENGYVATLNVGIAA